LAAEPDELLHDAGVVSDAGTVERVVTDILQASVGAELVSQLELPVERAGELLEEVVRYDAVLIADTDGEACACPLRAAAGGKVHVQRVPCAEETRHIVRVRDPRHVR